MHSVIRRLPMPGVQHSGMSTHLALQHGGRKPIALDPQLVVHVLAVLISKAQQQPDVARLEIWTTQRQGPIAVR
jgi:hypothetical protein